MKQSQSGNAGESMKKKMSQDQDMKEQEQAQAPASRPIGPTSIHGVEASELPDKGRGGPETNQHQQHARKLPHQTGENDTGDVGLRAFPSSADANDHGYRKGN